MSEQARQLLNEATRLRKEAEELQAQASAVCGHENHFHTYDSDGPGYVCEDCADWGYGPCPDWPAPHKNARGEKADGATETK